MLRSSRRLKHLIASSYTSEAAAASFLLGFPLPVRLLTPDMLAAPSTDAALVSPQPSHPVSPPSFSLAATSAHPSTSSTAGPVLSLEASPTPPPILAAESHPAAPAEAEAGSVSRPFNVHHQAHVDMDSSGLAILRKPSISKNDLESVLMALLERNLSKYRLAFLILLCFSLYLVVSVFTCFSPFLLPFILVVFLSGFEMAVKIVSGEIPEQFWAHQDPRE